MTLLRGMTLRYHASGGWCATAYEGEDRRPVPLREGERASTLACDPVGIPIFIEEVGPPRMIRFYSTGYVMWIDVDFDRTISFTWSSRVSYDQIAHLDYEQIKELNDAGEL